jgi:hypothetical protein
MGLISILDVLVCLVLGVLAIPNLIIAKRPDAKKIIDKVAPFQGWIGLVAAVWGAWKVLDILFHISAVIFVMTHGGVIWFIGILAYIVYALLMLVLGLLLGVGTLKMLIKNPQAQAKLDQTLAKIQPHQGTLGVVALIDGVVLLLYALHILK